MFLVNIMREMEDVSEAIGNLSVHEQPEPEPEPEPEGGLRVRGVGGVPADGVLLNVEHDEKEGISRFFLIPKFRP